MGQANDAEGERLPVVVIGLGEIGRDVLRGALLRPELDVRAVADPAHEKASWSEVLGEPAPRGTVLGEAGAAFAKARGGVALVCTTSRLAELEPLLLAAARAGLSVVSSCEELAFPFVGHPEVADRLERAFRKAGTACLGTGVNPGFVLDRLPAFLGGVVGPVRHLLAARTVDVATRRPALQRKVGAGLSPDAFAAGVEAGTLGHVGLVESLALAAEGLDLLVDEVEEEIDPVLAAADFDTGVVRGRAGDAAGLRQVARGFHEGRELLRLELTMAVGAESEDELRLDADPPIHLVVPGGLAGDPATTQALLNAAAQVAGAEAGLMTVLDLPAGR